MSRARVTRLYAGLPAVLAAVAQAAPVPAPVIAEAQLRTINHRAVSALATADRDYLAALTATDFLLTGITGEWIGRAQRLAMVRELPVPAGISYDDVQVRLFGPVALTHGLLETIDAAGVAKRVRYTDAYHWNGLYWRLINSQHTALRDGVATTLQRGQAPRHAPWRGTDPTGDDSEVLGELNANYVRAFREADVAWYDAHLAPDYVVVNSDGSIHDRARALAEFAEPAYATTMRSFPVDKVRIRRFGDIALIHAENAYERKDRRRGVNRYTDIWRKQPDGRWLCLAAHITTHKAPGEA